MKKLLLLILIALLLALTMIIMIQGVQFGSFEILGIKGIQSSSKELDETIQEAAKLAEKDYTQAVSDVETSAKKLKEEKENYENMVTISDSGDVENANQLETYEIETLWVRIGNHATSQGVVMQMDVTTSSTSAQGYYNLKFTATGGYINITDFVSAIENDSMLGFKIEEFKLVPTEDNTQLKATFTCSNIAIKEVSSTTPATTTTDGTNTATDANTTNSTTNNTTNSTNTNSNTTNSSNTTNTAAR